jgi:peptidoglycan/LPS O-acetylase OafA/YrhL
MIPTESPRARYRDLVHEPALDGIRGVAVLTVMLWHYYSDILELSEHWVKSGHLGVDLFFVLSGFLITALMLNEHQHNGKISLRGFYRRRAFRLLPALVIFLSVHFVWALLTDIPTSMWSPGTELDNEIASVLSALFFSLNLLPFFGDYTATLGLGHLWSLAVEEQFYFTWPLITVALLSRAAFPYVCLTGVISLLVAFTGHLLLWDEWGEVARWGSSIGTGFSVVIVMMAVRSQGWDVRALVVLSVLTIFVLMFRTGLYDGSLRATMTIYSSLPGRADSLIVGAGLAYLWVSGRIPRRCHSFVSVIAWCFFGWFVTGFTLAEPFFLLWGWTLVALCGALIVWGSLGSEGTLYGRVLTMSWLRAIGKVAYGLYLWHVFVFAAVRHWFGDESVLLKTVLALGITAAITMASWFWVERPALAYKRTRS